MTPFGTGGDIKPTRTFFDACLEVVIARNSTPEGLSRHSHDHVVDFGGADQINGVIQRLIELYAQLLHLGLGREVSVVDVDAAKQRRNTGNAHAIEVRLDDGVGTRCQDTKLLAESELITHVCSP